MSGAEPWPLTRERLLEYFLQAAKPRASWLVGMEVEKMGRAAESGAPLPYDGAEPSIRGVLEFIRARRGGDPIFEGDRLIGVDGDWGTISLEPGGQVEWSSRPRPTLAELDDDLRAHLRVLQESERALALRWLPEAVDPTLPLAAMVWMPKARYSIMRPYLGERGGLAHRMMTQTASIQCAYDYADPEDWRRKFKAAALLAPAAVALFGNSSRIDGRDIGFHSYREEIWRDTDPDRCGLPRLVFDAGFDIERWLDHVIDVPTIFRHKARGLVPAGGIPFGRLLQRVGCDAVRTEDWETHISTIFTEVRSYTYIEVRSADLQPDGLALAVPTFWTGILYEDAALDEALELGRGIDDYERWRAALDSAARQGLDGSAAGRPLRELAGEALRIARAGLLRGAACSTDGAADARPLEALARHRELELGC